MMRTIGPAPNAVGETKTRLSETLAVTLIGSGGLSLFLWLSVSPHPADSTVAPTLARISTRPRSVLWPFISIPGKWSLVLGGSLRFAAAWDDLRALLVELLELALQPIPGPPLRVLVVASLQLAQAVAIGTPRARPPLVELLELSSLDAVRREGRHRALLLWWLMRDGCYPQEASRRAGSRARMAAKRPVQGVSPVGWPCSRSRLRRPSSSPSTPRRTGARARRAS